MSEALENGHGQLPHDIQLGIGGFYFSDLFDAVKLHELADKFYAEVAEREPVLGGALLKYIAARGLGFEKRVESKILTDAAPFLSDFIARLFNVVDAGTLLERKITVQNPVWKYKFFVQRRAAKKYKPDVIAELNENELWNALTELRKEAFSDTLVHDEELSIAEMTCRLLDAEDALVKTGSGSDGVPEINAADDTVARVNAAYEKLKDSAFGKLFSEYVVTADASGNLLAITAALHLTEAWSAAAFHNKSRKWFSFKTPHGLDYQNLVHLIHPEPELHNIMRGGEDILRKRDEIGRAHV